MPVIGFAVVLTVSLALAPLGAEAQPVPKVQRIGVLREGPDPATGALADAMRELGWVEGQNFTIERRQADRREQLPALAAELVRLKVDLILTTGTPATRAAKEATKTIPIVFTLAGDPVESGLVASFARPGGNVTGFAQGVPDEKLLEVLKEAVPGVMHVVYPSAAGESPRRPARLTAAARVLGVGVQGVAVGGPADFDRFFATARRQGAGAALVWNVAWFRPHLERLGAAAARSRLPAIGYDRRFAESGGLLSYGPTPLQSVPRLAAQIDKIFKGAQPSDLPVERPTKFELLVNLKAARALGLTIPPTVILQADRVIE